MTTEAQPKRISRRSISKHPPAGTEKALKDPMQTLQEILDSKDFNPNEHLPSSEQPIDLKPLNDVKGDTLEEILFLSTCSKYDSSKDDVEYQELIQYKAKVESFAQLLAPLEQFLSNFNQQLVELSKELESLKNRSLKLSSSLQTRQDLENKYTPIVSDLLIPPDIIKNIYNSDINESWCDNLHFLDDKKQIYEKYKNSKEYSNMKSIAQLSSLLESLYLKVEERVRNFIVKKIKQLRVIGTPSQVVQNDLLKVKEVYGFLSSRQPSLALELRQAYVYTMRWYYHSYFQRYLHSLTKLKIHQIDNNYLIGGSHSFFKKNQLIDYSIGKRFQIINAQDPTVMLAQIAEHNQLTFFMETGFRSFNLSLIDNGSVEYLFLTEFFGLKNEANGLFEQIFNPTYQLGTNYTKSLIMDSFDIFGTLILIRLSQALIFELQTRRIPTMEDYLNLTMIVLWPKFQTLVDLNCENMKRSSSKSSAFDGIKPNSPHPLTIQFTNLLTGFLKLSAYDQHTQATQEPLYNSIMRFRNDYESVLTKLSKNINQKELFLYNNYTLVYSMLNECEGTFAKTETEHFRLLVDAYKPK